MNGTGTNSGTNATTTPTTTSSAKIFPKRRKLRDKGFVKSSKTLIGSNNGDGETYRLKYPRPFLDSPP